MTARNLTTGTIESTVYRVNGGYAYAIHQFVGGTWHPLRLEWQPRRSKIDRECEAFNAVFRACMTGSAH